MSELFSLNTTKPKKQNEYQKAYSLVYGFTDNKKLQGILIEYVKFRIESCSSKGYRFYSSSIKAFLQSILDKMPDNTDDEVWEAVNLTLSYSAMRLLVPYNKSTSSKKFDEFIRPNLDNSKPSNGLLKKVDKEF